MQPPHRLGLVLAPLALAAAAGAQSFTLTIDPGQSQWSWSGTTSIGPLQGNPNQDFQLSGTVEMAMIGGGNPIGGGQILSANAIVSPDLHGLIPNPLPFLPPLATIDVTGLSFSMATPQFLVDAAGNFTTVVTVTILTGTLTVTPLSGSQTVTDLAGTQGNPSPIAGTLTETGGTIVLHSPQNSTFQFTDPASGITGDLTLTGVLHATFACPAPTNYCPLTPNSVGPGAAIDSTGSTSITANGITLIATGAPPNVFGVFYYGPNQIQVPFGEGFRCVGGGVRRLPVVNSGTAGTFVQAWDFTNLPGGDVLLPGEVVQVQCWFRDPPGGPAGFNLSNARTFLLCP